MNRKPLLLVLIFSLPLPAFSADPAMCATFLASIDTNLKDAALGNMLAKTAPNPAMAASSAQAATSAMQAAEQNVQLSEQNGCGTYPRPLNSSGYNSDAMYCAYEMLQQRPPTTICDRSTWTVKGQLETWHSFGNRPHRGN